MYRNVGIYHFLKEIYEIFKAQAFWSSRDFRQAASSILGSIPGESLVVLFTCLNADPGPALYIPT